MAFQLLQALLERFGGFASPPMDFFLGRLRVDGLKPYRNKSSLKRHRNSSLLCNISSSSIWWQSSKILRGGIQNHTNQIRISSKIRLLTTLQPMVDHNYNYINIYIYIHNFKIFPHRTKLTNKINLGACPISIHFWTNPTKTTGQIKPARSRFLVPPWYLPLQSRDTQ